MEHLKILHRLRDSALVSFIQAPHLADDTAAFVPDKETAHTVYLSANVYRLVFETAGNA